MLASSFNYNPIGWFIHTRSPFAGMSQVR